MKTKTAVLMILSVIFIVILIGAALIFPKLSQAYEEDKNKSSFVQSNEMPASDFTVYDENGKEVSLSDSYGKPIVVNFWATWCGYCVKELPDFDALYKEYGDEIVFMMVDLPDGQRETESSARSFIKEKGYSFPIYFDLNGSASKAYVENGIPVTVFIDKNGNLSEKHIGMMNANTLRKYLEKMVGE